MHPEIAKTLIAQRRDELVHSASRRRGGRRPFPRWHVSWTRTVLTPVAAPGSAGAGRAGHQGGRRGSALVIIISAHRSA